MLIQKLKVTDYPVIVFTDVHCDLGRLQKLRSLYPHYQFVSLGDNCDLYARNSNQNQLILQYLIDNNIPAVSGNHCEHVSGVVNGDTITFLDSNNKLDINYYNLPRHQCNYLKNLPRGIKLIFPNGENYLLFHQLPKDVWSFKNEGTLTTTEFLAAYPFDSNSKDAVHGHLHSPFIEEFTGTHHRRVCVGELRKHGHYAIITADGIRLKQL